MKVKMSVGLPHDLLEWHEKEFPGISISAIITLLWNEFRAIHEETGVTPRKVARDAAKEVKAQIDEGLFEGDGKRDKE